MSLGVLYHASIYALFQYGVYGENNHVRIFTKSKVHWLEFVNALPRIASEKQRTQETITLAKVLMSADLSAPFKDREGYIRDAHTLLGTYLLEHHDLSVEDRFEVLFWKVKIANRALPYFKNDVLSLETDVNELIGIASSMPGTIDTPSLSAAYFEEALFYGLYKRNPQVAISSYEKAISALAGKKEFEYARGYYPFYLGLIECGNNISQGATDIILWLHFGEMNSNAMRIFLYDNLDMYLLQIERVIAKSKGNVCSSFLSDSFYQSLLHKE